MAEAGVAGPGETGGYLFAYFTGEGHPEGEQVHLALSRGADPLHYVELNRGRPVLTSRVGSHGVRDPFLVRDPEGGRFWLLGTDLRIYDGAGWDAAERHGSRSIVIWESADLVAWSEPRLVGLAPPDAGDAWAPEACWDAEAGCFLLFWASTLFDPQDTAHAESAYHRMLSVTTRDFVTFTPVRAWHDPGHSVIDSTVVRHVGEYYRFTKDERSSTSPGAKRIVAERSARLSAPAWRRIADDIGAPDETGRGIVRGEGPAIVRAIGQNRWILFIDEYGGRGYVPFEASSPDSTQWSMCRGYRLPSGARHGSVLPVSRLEHDRLLAAYGPAAGVERNPVLPGLTADPHLVACGDRFYLYATSDGFAEWGSSSFEAWSSSDLGEWISHGVILDLLRDTTWARSQAWAPAVAEHHGRYYLYFCAEQSIGVAVSDSPTGPFVDALGHPLVDKADAGGNQQIDPSVFVDADGRAYLCWGNARAWIARLTDDRLGLVAGSVRELTGLVDFCEAPFLVERDGIYHLTWSCGDTRSEDYRVRYASGPSPYGPWSNRGTLLAKRPEAGVLGTGHHSILRIPGTDEWYLAYHRFAVPDGDGTHRETCIDRLYFDDDGWMKPVSPSREGVPPR